MLTSFVGVDGRLIPSLVGEMGATVAETLGAFDLTLAPVAKTREELEPLGWSTAFFLVADSADGLEEEVDGGIFSSFELARFGAVRCIC